MIERYVFIVIGSMSMVKTRRFPFFYDIYTLYLCTYSNTLIYQLFVYFFIFYRACMPIFFVFFFHFFINFISNFTSNFLPIRIIMLSLCSFFFFFGFSPLIEQTIGLVPSIVRKYARWSLFFT